MKLKDTHRKNRYGQQTILCLIAAVTVLAPATFAQTSTTPVEPRMAASTAPATTDTTKTVEEHNDTLAFYFRTAMSNVDRLVRDNHEQLERLQTLVDILGKESSDTVFVSLIGSASPEGYGYENQKLSERRAKAVEDVLRNKVGLGDVVYDSKGIGDNWVELRRLVVNSDMANRDQVVKIIDETNDPPLYSERKLKLMRLNAGNTWREMDKRFFPLLRKTDMTAHYSVEHYLAAAAAAAAAARDTVVVKEIETVVDTVVVKEVETVERVDTVFVEREEVAVPVVEPVVAPNGHLILFKTNLLYDALAVPNLGFEIPLPRRFSIGGDWMYAWWKSDKAHRYWRTYGGDLFVRKWFGGGETICTGHHVGLYGGIVTYDFEFGGRGYLGDRWSYGGGLEYGYSIKIANRLNLDFTIGLGYLGGKFKEYIPDHGCYVWQVTKNRNWFGPTKAEISLVWIVGNGNRVIKKKGGDL